MIDVSERKSGDVLVLFKVPLEARVDSGQWAEQVGMELHACLTGSDYAHCELHFVQSDVGLGCGVDVDGVVFLWNKQYDASAYACVYRVQLKAARYNQLLRWAIEVVDGHPTYDHAYMSFYCWLCWFRACIPLRFSESRLNSYTCASIVHSALAVAGLTDLHKEGATREKRIRRAEEMTRDRNVTVYDVLDMLELTSLDMYAASSDVLLVKQLQGVPPRMCRKVEIPQ